MIEPNRHQRSVGGPDKRRHSRDSEPSTDEFAVEARPDFTVFYHDRYRPIAAALASTLADRDLAREATDEAMARCFANWDKVSRFDNAAGWVYRVGLNWALSARRRLARRWTHAPADYVDPTMPTDPQIVEALAKLEIRQRAVVVCRVLLDWSTEETADALQIRPGTVKSRLHRGLALLGEHLAHFEQGNC